MKSRVTRFGRRSVFGLKVGMFLFGNFEVLLYLSVVACWCMWL